MRPQRPQPISRPARPGARRPGSRSGSRRSGAFALITVLAILAIMVVLTTAMMTLSQTELAQASSASETARARQLAEIPANVVIAQLQEATTNLGLDSTWASQPGMVRVFGTAPGPDGRAALERAYRLYSSPRLNHEVAVHGAFDPLAEMAALANWHQQPGRFTDLNQPVRRQSQLTYPIADPTAIDLIDGFEVEGMTPELAGERDLPMPASWVYVLRDGSMTTPDGWNAERQAATWSAAAPNRPTADNPIVGRIAWWTDDETAKLNINTASEGAFWDHPYANNRTERGNSPDIVNWITPPYGFASSLASRDEYYRYPGHPATTSLSAVLGNWLPSSLRPTEDQLRDYTLMTPRVALGGSRGGHVLSENAQPVVTDNDRLYSSVDEVLLAPGRQPSLLGSVAGPADVERLRFFLTSHGRGSELNLFNQPRIALWPLYQNNQLRTSVDQLIAFSSSVNRRPYYFQRHSNSTQSQIGSGLSVSQDFSLQRNQQLLEYLSRLTSREVPGFGHGTMEQKYGIDRDALLIGMFDKVRGMVNVFNRGTEPRYDFTPPHGAGLGEFFIAPVVVNFNGNEQKGFGQSMTITEAALVIMPTELEQDESIPPDERQATRVRAYLIFETFKPAPGMPHQSPAVHIQVRGLNQFQLDNQPMGFAADASTYIEREQFGGGWGSFNAHSPLLLQFISHGSPVGGDNSPKGVDVGAQFQRIGVVSAEVELGPVTGDRDTETMSFRGGEIDVVIRSHERSGRSEVYQTLTMQWPDAEWPRPRRDGSRPNSNLNLQQRIIEAAGSPGAPTGLVPQPLRDHIWKLNGASRDARRILIQFGDVVRSVEVSPQGPSGGDYRIIAGLTSVGPEFFHPHPRYFESDFASRDAHSLRDDKFSALGMPGWRTSGTTPAHEIATGETNRPSNISHSGRLVADANYGLFAAPSAAHGMNGAFMANGRPGDWETGLSILPDGPFVRRLFESSSRRNAAGTDFIRNDSSYYLYGFYYHDGIGIDFAPNRQIASAVSFGALPSGMHAGAPWQTLLFSPNPAALRAGDAMTGSVHKGFEFPRDHLWLDLFWMPASEPWAVSETFSTAGKVNMNYDIMPWRYIKRRSPVQGVMRGVRMTAIPAGAAGPQNGAPGYKDTTASPWEFRYAIDATADRGTLRGFEQRFEQGDIFRSASEICEIFLVPQRLPTGDLPPNTSYPSVADPAPAYDDMAAWWENFTLTGDNLREMPYNHIYPRLTTKSNTYTVHYRVQTLRKARGSAPDEWVEGRDRVTAEQRGASLVERFIDPDNPNLPDPAAAGIGPATPSFEDYASYRILMTRQLR